MLASSRSESITAAKNSPADTVSCLMPDGEGSKRFIQAAERLGLVWAIDLPSFHCDRGPAARCAENDPSLELPLMGDSGIHDRGGVGWVELAGEAAVSTESTSGGEVNFMER